MERYVSVPSDRNIQDHSGTRSSLTGQNGWTKICHSILTNQSIALFPLHLNIQVYVGNSEKSKKWLQEPLIPLGWTSLIGKYHIIFLGYSNWFPTSQLA